MDTEINLENIWHVYPKNDTKQHLLECDYPPIGNPLCNCPCEPDWKREKDGIIIVHNSFDGREGLEWTKEILNSEK